MRRGQGNGIVVFLILIVVLGGFGTLLWVNARPTEELRVIVPTQAEPTDENNAWNSLLSDGFGENSTPLPTVAIPTGEFAPPTLAIAAAPEVNQVNAVDVSSGEEPTPFSIPATPTLAPSRTPASVAAAPVDVTAQSVTQAPIEWQPPPLRPPLSRDPLGRDHYWFIRPVDSNAVNYGLFYYPYGSDGNAESPLRVHHGIDMSNPVGETVRAAGSGTVIWAADGLRVEGGVFENSPSYGNVVVIEHDFGYRGQPLYTVYAHLSAALVRPDQYVEAGDVVGLVGNSGRVTGPHVHFEVRMGENRYASTYNPVLWMVPYVGHGVIAGRVTSIDDELANDVTVTVRNWRTGLVEQTTTTYILQDTGFDVNLDPVWQENFAAGDIPVGRYQVIANIGGERISKIVDVLEGTTSFVDLSPALQATELALTRTP